MCQNLAISPPAPTGQQLVKISSIFVAFLETRTLRRLPSPINLFSLISIKYHPKMQQNILLHCELVLQDESLTFSCLKKKQFPRKCLKIYSQLMFDFFFRQQKILLTIIIVRLNPEYFATKLYLIFIHYYIFNLQAWFELFPW